MATTTYGAIKPAPKGPAMIGGGGLNGIRPPAAIGGGGLNLPGLTEPNPAPIYPGGAAGKEADLGIRNSYINQVLGMEEQRRNRRSQMEESRYSTKASLGGMMSEADKSGAIGELRPAQQYWQKLMQTGMYTTEEAANIVASKFQLVNDTAKNERGELHNSLMARGLGADPRAMAAMGFNGALEAAGARGDAIAQIGQQQAESRIRGGEGFANVSGQIADLVSRPTRESAGSYVDSIFSQSPVNDDPNMTTDMANLYQQLINSQVGRDGAETWQQPAGQKVKRFY